MNADNFARVSTGERSELKEGGSVSEPGLLAERFPGMSPIVSTSLVWMALDGVGRRAWKSQAWTLPSWLKRLGGIRRITASQHRLFSLLSNREQFKKGGLCTRMTTLNGASFSSACKGPSFRIHHSGEQSQAFCLLSPALVLPSFDLTLTLPTPLRLLLPPPSLSLRRL